MTLALDRLLPRALIVIALAALLAGGAAWAAGDPTLANWLWAAGAIPVIVGLIVSIARDLLAGRFGVDAVALLSMIGALALSQNFSRRSSLRSCMPAAMRSRSSRSPAQSATSDRSSTARRGSRIGKRAGEVDDVPVVGGRGRRPVARARRGGRSGRRRRCGLGRGARRVGAHRRADSGHTTRRARRRAAARSMPARPLSLEAMATEGESTYAGIVRMATAAQTAKAPTIRTADRFALLLLPVSLALAGLAWGLSGDPVRGLAVLVTATPCPLILAAPVAYIAGVARAARRGILMKGGLALEALARTRTAIFDKTGTLTVGGARDHQHRDRARLERRRDCCASSPLSNRRRSIPSPRRSSPRRANEGSSLETPSERSRSHGLGARGRPRGAEGSRRRL